jgi:hypothetical protein
MEIKDRTRTQSPSETTGQNARIVAKGGGRQRLDGGHLAKFKHCGRRSAVAPKTSNSKDDSKLLAQHIQKQHASRQAAENRGFTTKAVGDLEALKKANDYSHTQLAIQFPNAMVVKANLLPQEMVRVVMDELRAHVFVREYAASLPPFELYITSPRQMLEPNKTLLEMGLIMPATKVYVSWKQPLQVPKGDCSTWFMRPELLQSKQKGLATVQGHGRGRQETSCSICADRWQKQKTQQDQS